MGKKAFKMITIYTKTNRSSNITGISKHWIYKALGLNAGSAISTNVRLVQLFSFSKINFCVHKVKTNAYFKSELYKESIKHNAWYIVNIQYKNHTKP